MSRRGGLAAVARVARRQARRAPARSLLVVLLVALPIAGLTAAVVAIRSAFATDTERVTAQIGSADLVLWPSNRREGERLVASLPPGTEVTARVERGAQTTIDARSVSFSVEELSPAADRGPGAGLFHLVAGRMPTAPDEAAIDPVTLRALDGRIGGDVTIPVLDTAVHVTGTVVLPEYVSQSLAVVGPGTLPAHGLRTAPSYLVDLPPGTPVEATARALQGNGSRAQVVTRGEVAATLPFGRAIATGLAFAGGLIGLVATGLIVAAAFAVGARRQLRTLGLVAAAGGERWHLRRIVLLGGGVLGLAGSLLGVLIGIVAVLPARALIGRIANRVVGPLRVPLLPVLGAVALGTFASMAASFLPARSAAKVTTVEALAGHTLPPKPPGRIAAAGVAVVGIGGVVLAWAAGQRSDEIAALGSVVMLAGFLVGIPLIVSWIGRLAGVLPTIPRIAARDLARHGRRTGPAIAAVTVALALPVAVGALTLSQDASERSIPFMADDQVVVGFFDGTSTQTPAEARALLGELRGAFPSATIVPIRDATWRDTGHLPYLAGPIQHPAPDPDVQGGTGADSRPVRAIGTLIVGGADTLRALHAEDGVAALRAGTVIAVGPDATDHGAIHLARKGPIPVDLPLDTVTLSATDAGDTRYASVVDAYTYVISRRAAAAAGLSSKPTETFVARLPRDLTGADRDRVAAIVERYPGATFDDLSNLGSQNGPGRWAFGVAGTTLALLIVAVVVALIGEESRRDRAIVAAVGASPRTRRALAGASAWVVAAAAGALAVPAGFVPVAVFRFAQDRGYPIVVPWAPIATALLGVPLVAGLVAFALARRLSPLALLRPIA